MESSNKQISDPSTKEKKIDVMLNILLDMIEAGDFGQVEKVLRFGNFANNRDDARGTPLMTVLHNPVNVDLLHLLVAYGASVHLKDPATGLTPLHLALRRDLSDDVIYSLLQYSPDVNNRDLDGQALIVDAVRRCRNPDLLWRLVNSGAAVNVCDHRDGAGRTLLMAAIQAYAPRVTMGDSRCFEKVVGALLNAKADVNAADQHWRTPLMVAVEQEKVPVSTVAALIDCGALVNARNVSGHTALDFAIACINQGERQKNLLCLLIIKGAEIDYQNPIHLNGVFSLMKYATETLGMRAALVIFKKLLHPTMYFESIAKLQQMLYRSRYVLPGNSLDLGNVSDSGVSDQESLPEQASESEQDHETEPNSEFGNEKFLEFRNLLRSG